MNATVKQIFNYISSINPNSSTISSIGTFVTASNQSIADEFAYECKRAVPESSFAYKILTSNYKKLSDKQLWVIAFECEKNAEYSEMVGNFYAKIQKKEDAKKAESDYKLACNKDNSQPVLDFVKSKGKKLGDYYSFVKSNKRYAREFYSKNFSMESANEFLNK